MDRNILVTAISGDISNGILKILQEDPQNRLYGCDVHQINVGMDKVRGFWQTKFAMQDGYINDLLDKCKEHTITHLIPVNEKEIEIISKNREKFYELGIKMPIHSECILDICFDKYKTMEFLEENGIPIAYTYHSLEEINGSTTEKKRFIIKPRKSNGSKRIKIVDQLEEAIDFSEYVIQDYIESDDEYTLGVFRHEDKCNTIAFKRVLRAGFSYIVELEHSIEIEQLGRQVANILDVDGYINIQMRKKDNKYYIFEINPRISGTVMFRHMLGFTDLVWWLDVLDGDDVEPYHCRYSEAVGIRELNEKFVILNENNEKSHNAHSISSWMNNQEMARLEKKEKNT